MMSKASIVGSEPVFRRIVSGSSKEVCIVDAYWYVS